MERDFLAMKLFREAPHPGWLPFVKMLFGFLLLIILGTLAGVIAIGHVIAMTSYGLDIILGGLLTLSGGFVGWAFREGRDRIIGDTNNTKDVSPSETQGTAESAENLR